MNFHGLLVRPELLGQLLQTGACQVIGNKFEHLTLGEFPWPAEIIAQHSGSTPSYANFRRTQI